MAAQSCPFPDLVVGVDLIVVVGGGAAAAAVVVAVDAEAVVSSRKRASCNHSNSLSISTNRRAPLLHFWRQIPILVLYGSSSLLETHTYHGIVHQLLHRLLALREDELIDEISPDHLLAREPGDVH